MPYTRVDLVQLGSKSTLKRGNPDKCRRAAFPILIYGPFYERALKKQLKVSGLVRRVARLELTIII